MSTKQGPRTEVVTTLRLSPEDHEAFKLIAAREHRSLSGQVRHWIERQMREQEKQAA